MRRFIAAMLFCLGGSAQAQTYTAVPNGSGQYTLVPNGSGQFLPIGGGGSTPTLPSVPQNVSANSASATSVLISYTAPASGYPASYTYTTQIATSSGGTYATVSGCSLISALTCTATGLTTGTPYYFKVAATNATGTGPYSAYVSATPSSTVVQDPGPSAALFASPYYTCSTNYYVSQTGNDTTGTGTSGNPWLTMAHANSQITTGTGGVCVNVVASGTAYAGVVLTKSGSGASSTGYIVYKCTTMDGCAVTPNANMNSTGTYVGFGNFGTNGANFIMVDGFSITGSGVQNEHCFDFTGATNGTNTSGSHHIWVLNSVCTGAGGGGIITANSDYTYFIHNTVSGSAIASNCNTAAQESGMADNVPQDVNYWTSYTATADDKTNPNSLIGSFVVGGTSWFHKVYEWNVLYNNHEGACSSNSNSDGNNFILDTFLSTASSGVSGGPAVDYPDQTLVAYNVSYNAGGVGIHVFRTAYVTVANNSTYNDGLDPNLNGGHPNMDNNGGFGNTYINNISIAIPQAPVSPTSCSYSGTPVAQFNSSILGGALTGKTIDTFTNNITEVLQRNSCYGSFGLDAPTGEAPMFNLDASPTYAYVCTTSSGTNQCATSPAWVNVGSTSTGTESTPPNGVNFALQSGSPAIGAGVTKTYLPATSVDVGACYHTLTSCP